MQKQIRTVVVGGGLAGLSAAMKLAEKGCRVDLICLTNAKRSHSVCAQGGINAATNVMGEDDSPLIHAYDTVKGGDYLADQPPVVEMCLAAPKIIYMLDRMGCPFNRTLEGEIDCRRFGGTLYKRTAFCGGTTGQQLMYTLDEQVRKFEVEGLVHRFEHHEFTRLIVDEEGRAAGLVILDHHTMQYEYKRCDAVVFATGGSGMVFGRSTNSTICTGAAMGLLYMQGLKYANPEFIQIHPTAISGKDKCRLISESVRGEGGRVSVPGNGDKTMQFPDGSIRPCGKTGEPWYFLEEMYPAFGNLVPRDVAARELIRVCKQGLGVDGKNQVHLDVTHLSAETLAKLEGVLDIYRQYTGDDPKDVPMKIFPAVHYTMGGLFVDYPAMDDPDRENRYRQMTSIPGVFAAGECEFLYHGANRLGANSLMACIFAGLVAGDDLIRYVDSFERDIDALPEEIFLEGVSREVAKKQRIMAQQGAENIYALHEEMGELMLLNATVERSDAGLDETLSKLKEIRKRLTNVSLDDRSATLNQSLIFAMQMEPMVEIAIAIVKGARHRNEFRGSHFKEGFKERDDENFQKHTIMSYRLDEPDLEYKDVDKRHFDASLRDYQKAKKIKPTVKNLAAEYHSPV